VHGSQDLHSLAASAVLSFTHTCSSTFQGAHHARYVPVGTQ